MWDDLFDPEESRDFFRAEAETLLRQIDAELPHLERSLESGTTNVTAVNAVMRALRSIQRSSGMLGYNELRDLAVRLERLGEIVRDGSVPLAESGVEMFVAGRAFLSELTTSSLGGSQTPRAALEYIERLERLTAIYSETARIRARQPAAPSAALPEPPDSLTPPAPVPPPSTARTLRIELQRVDEIARCIGDVTVQAARLDLLGGEAAAAAAILERAANDMHQALIATRQTTVGQGFDWLPAAVAAMSKAAGKRVAIEMSGTDTPFDRAVLLEAGEVLMHVLRYCIDSDIEKPSDRERARKPATAILGLTSFACGNRAVFELVADGAGRKASAEELVRDARGGVERLGGSLAVKTLSGRGLYATLAFPLPPGLMRCILVSAAGDTFAVPFDTALETQTIAERDPAIPLLSLAEFFQLERAEEAADAFVVNVAVRDATVALAIERIEGERQVAVAPLSRLMGPVAGIAGAAVLGDGSIALVVDAPALITAASKRRE